MAFTATYSKNLIGLDNIYTISSSYSAGAKLSISETIASGVSHQPVNFEFGTGSGILLAMSTNTTYPITIKTNSTGTPDNTFIFNNNETRIFADITGQDVDSLAQPLENINSLFVSNTGTTVLTLTIDSLYDPTP